MDEVVESHVTVAAEEGKTVIKRGGKWCTYLALVSMEAVPALS